MTRIVYSANATELQKSGVLGCIMADLDFASGHIYVNDGFHVCTFGGNVYQPLGKFGGIDTVDEGLDQLARPLKLTLSGVDPSLIGTAETEIYQNRSVIIYVALINQTTGALVATPETAWEGRMDYMEIGLDQNKGVITLNCEPRLRREPRIARYTDADQQEAYAGDTFFSFTPTIQGFKSSWGDQAMSYGGPGSDPGSGPRGGRDGGGGGGRR